MAWLLIQGCLCNSRGWIMVLLPLPMGLEQCYSGSGQTVEVFVHFLTGYGGCDLGMVFAHYFPHHCTPLDDPWHTY